MPAWCKNTRRNDDHETIRAAIERLLIKRLDVPCMRKCNSDASRLPLLSIARPEPPSFANACHSSNDGSFIMSKSWIITKHSKETGCRVSSARPATK